MNTPKLFAVYLGGRADRCNIELHDVVFVIGSSIQETYPLLAKKWFGNMNHFHIDSYLELNTVDGYEIKLSKKPSKQKKSHKLYFINLGAYKPNEFSEYHECGFYVAENASEAVQRAKTELCKGLESIHKDDVVLLDHVNQSLDADDILTLENVDEYYITLQPTASKERPLPISKYIRLDTLLFKS